MGGKADLPFLRGRREGEGGLGQPSAAGGRRSEGDYCAAQGAMRPGGSRATMRQAGYIKERRALPEVLVFFCLLTERVLWF